MMETLKPPAASRRVPPGRTYTYGDFVQLCGIIDEIDRRNIKPVQMCGRTVEQHNGRSWQSAVGLEGVDGVGNPRLLRSLPKSEVVARMNTPEFWQRADMAFLKARLG